MMSLQQYFLNESSGCNNIFSKDLPGVTGFIELELEPRAKVQCYLRPLRIIREFFAKKYVELSD
jgi:hypothetical protein